MAVKAQNNDYVGDAIEFNTSGWIEDAEEHTWDFASADGKTFVVSVDADVTGVISVGMRWRCTQGTVQYAIVTAVGEYSGGYTQVTLYAGTDYAIVDAAIEDVGYSGQKAPFGFPLNPSKWTVEVIDANTRTQSSPTEDTWYNLNAAHKIDIPIGAWYVSYRALAYNFFASSQLGQIWLTLSTSNNSASDSDMSTSFHAYGTTSIGFLIEQKPALIVLTSKTTYYLNMYSEYTVSSMGLYGAGVPTKIRAVCAYL